MKNALQVFTGIVLAAAVGVVPLATVSLAKKIRGLGSGALNKLGGSMQGIGGKARERVQQSGFYQRNQMAQQQRKAERQRQNTANYANMITSDTAAGRRLRRRAGGWGAEGQNRARISGLGAQEKLEREETQNAAFMLERSRVNTPSQLREIAAGRSGVGIDGQVVNGAGNRALQLAAIQKLIKAQDAGELENLFMDRGVDQSMLVSELTKESNYATSKGAGAHLVQMGVRPGGAPYTRSQVNAQAVASLSALARDKLSQQDGPAIQSAAAGFVAGAGTAEQRRALWDRVNEIYSDQRALANVKGSARAALETIRNSHP